MSREDRDLVERAKADLIAELNRQAERSGCTTETDGRYVQVDGSFNVELLARAVIAALSR